MGLATYCRRRAGVLAAMAVFCVLLGGGIAGPAEAEPIPLQDRVLLGEGTFEAINPCTGETILGTGSTYQYSAGVFFTDGNLFISAGRIVSTATLTSAETGVTYRLRITTTNSVHASFTQDPATSSGGLFSTTQRLISQGPADNFFLVIKTFVMSDPSGVTHVSYLVEDSGCIG